MNSHDTLEVRLRQAFRASQAVDPTPDEIAAAIQRAEGARPHHRPRRWFRLVLVPALLVAATAAAVPQTRHSVVDAFDGLGDFLSGKGPSPGRPAATDPTSAWDWVRTPTGTAGTVVAESDGLRIVSYRDQSTGQACVSYGSTLAECRSASDWQTLLGGVKVYLVGPIAEPRGDGALPLMGVSSEDITSVELEYADGTREGIGSVNRGFIVSALPGRGPRILRGFDKTGAAITTLDISDRAWETQGP